MIYLAIIDDEQSTHDLLTTYLNNISKETNVDLSIIHFYSAEDLLKSTNNIDIALFDIEMPKVNGMDAAKEFRESHSKAVIIFITNRTDYAIQGYSVEALDYVLKPINEVRFVSLIRKAIRIVESTKNNVVSIKSNGNYINVEVSDIAYIEINDHLLLIHLDDGTILDTWMSLSNIEKLLPRNEFIKISSSILVKVNKVGKIGKSTIYLKPNNKEIPFTIAKRKEIINQFKILSNI